jgi:NAD(P)-dependent dehydrogenase (short-subunit alcohol dehydrogenase family)
MADTQCILITGANRGIGLALARELLSKGHSVVAACRHPGESQELKQLEMIHHRAITLVQMDVTSDAAVDGASKMLGRECPALDILVNNAAIFPEEGNETLAEMNLQHFRDAFETNVVAVARVSRAFLPLLQKAKNPRIVNISSGVGSISLKEDFSYYAYATSKAALNMLTRAMAAELKPRRICVVALSPGWVRTDMGGSNAPLSPEESARAITKTICALTMDDASSFVDRYGVSGGEYSW